LDIFCGPGNAGIAHEAQLVSCSVDDHEGLIEFARSQKIDLTFVGPEAPLATGLVDRFEVEGVPIVGPTKSAARLEASKVFAKKFMSRHGIPTAAYRIAESADEAIAVIRSGKFGSSDRSVVIKADGLAAGKGVVVASSGTEAEAAIESLMIKKSVGAEAAERVLIEQALSGEEASVLLFSDGRDYVLMPPARDHKRIGEGDTGPNTGGMGCVTDPSILDDDTLEQVIHEIIEPTLDGADSEGFRFRGVLFLGLMLTGDGPKLLEYNVRFGDPETQAILVRLRTDLASIFRAIREGTLGRLKVEWSAGSSACVVAANRGYPGSYERGGLIEGLENAGEVQVFHAGTSLSPDGRYIATGGRVLGVTAAASNLNIALDRCYSALQNIHWEGMQYRRDIGRRAAAV
jgi:phosphoribosylamine--glycine ligase